MNESQRIVDTFWFGIWFAVAMVVFIYLTHRGTDGAPMRWQRWRDTLAARYILSSHEGDEVSNNDCTDDENDTFSQVKRNGEMSENSVVTGKTVGNDSFHFPDGFTMLARLVLAEKVGETDAIKLAVKVSPGKSPRYVEARARLHAAIEREHPPSGPQFPPLSEEQQATRESLALGR